MNFGYAESIARGGFFSTKRGKISEWVPDILAMRIDREVALLPFVVAVWVFAVVV